MSKEMKKIKTKDIMGNEIELSVCDGDGDFEIPDVLPTDIKVKDISDLMTKEQVIDMLRSVLTRLITSEKELDYYNIMRTASGFLLSNLYQNDAYMLYDLFTDEDLHWIKRYKILSGKCSGVILRDDSQKKNGSDI